MPKYRYYKGRKIVRTKPKFYGYTVEKKKYSTIAQGSLYDISRKYALARIKRIHKLKGKRNIKIRLR